MCTVCVRQCASPAALQQHYRDMAVHPKCTRCNLGFKDNTAIQNHVSTTHHPISCGACNGLKVYREDLASHYKTSPNHPTCAVCNSGFENAQALGAHYKTSGNHPTCALCDIGFERMGDLTAHYKTSPAHPTCVVCDLGFANMQALADHYKTSASHPTCALCDIGFGRANDLTAHYKTSPVHSTCAVCDLGFAHVQDLADHYKTSASHPTCASCDIGFERMDDLSAHHRSSPAHPYCTSCDIGLEDDEALANHFLESESHPTCLGCRLGFRDEEEMQEHTISVHPAYRCIIHNRFFGTPTLLEAHYYDSEEHPKCPECHMAFADNMALIEHMNTMSDESDTESTVSDVSEETHHSEPIMPSAAATNGGSPVDTRPSSVTPHSRVLTPAGALQDRSELADVTVISSAQSIASESSPSPISRQPTSLPPSTESSMVSQPQANPIETQPQVVSLPSSPRDSLASQRSLLDASRLSQYAPVLQHRRFENEDARAVASPLRTDLGRHDFLMSSTEALKSATMSPVSERRGSFSRWTTVLHPPVPLVDSPSDMRSRSRSRTASTRTAAMPPVVLQPAFFTSARERTLSLLSDVTQDGFTRGITTASSRRSPSRSERGAYPVPNTAPKGRTRSPSVASTLPHTMMPTPTSTPTQQHTSSPSLVNSSSKRASSHGKGVETTPAQGAMDDVPRVSHIYCRMCRRDPCRLPTATMCGHIFCHSCISSKIMQEPYCPVCEGPTLLYSLIRLHVA
ncbi:hypothetical protein OF83DRAFT_575203 [Amylostereum chailletii]|nr:hypothetical protein OF83DRAFT_575203 [Amylostereum chailletii]